MSSKNVMTDGDKALTHTGDTAGVLDLDQTQVREQQVYAPPPQLSCVLKLEALPAHTERAASSTSNDHVLFRVTPNPDAGATFAAIAENPQPINLAVVIDRSGSMEGAPLDQAKRACSALLDLMGPDDIITLVAYSETADLIVPARRAANKALIRESLATIKPGSTTNLLLALRLAARQLVSVKDQATVNRILLITDGEPAAGVKEYAAIMSQASELAARGITISTFGLGSDYEEELLAGLAERAGGNYYHIPDVALIAEAFEREFRQIRKIVARNLQFRIHPTRGVNILRVFGHDAIYGPSSVQLKLCDLERDANLELVCAIEFTQRPAAHYRVATAELLYDDVGTKRPERLACELHYNFVEEADLSSSYENTETMAAVEVAGAVQVLDMTILAIRRQGLDADAVRTQLTKVQATLRDNSRNAEADLVASAHTAIDRGVPMSKVMMSTVFDLNQGKTS